MDNVLLVNVTLIYNERSLEWINISSCMVIKVMSSSDFENLMRILYPKVNGNTVNSHKWVIFFKFSEKESYSMGDFDNKEEAGDYLAEMFEKAVVLGVPNG